MAVALLVAAGRGERLGEELPKALVPLAGRPLLEWSLAALRAAAAIGEIVVALPAGAPPPDGVVAVAGGETRSQSVRAALAAAGDEDIVVVHDAARPLAEAGLFDAVVAELERSGADAVVAAAPVTDTIKLADGHGRVERTLERDSLWAVQTPQAFRRAALERALAQGDELLARATDDAWLVEQAGGTVRVLAAPPDNVKVTTPLDLELAALALERRC